MQYSRYLFHNNNLQNDGNLLCTSKCHESVLMVHCHGSCLRHFLSHHTNHLLQTSKSINQSINKSIYQSADICSASSTTFSAMSLTSMHTQLHSHVLMPHLNKSFSSGPRLLHRVSTVWTIT